MDAENPIIRVVDDSFNFLQLAIRRDGDVVDLIGDEFVVYLKVTVVAGRQFVYIYGAIVRLVGLDGGPVFGDLLIGRSHRGPGVDEDDIGRLQGQNYLE